MIITWKNTLDSGALPYSMMDSAKYAKIALSLGYPFFRWNETIYTSEGEIDTGFKAADLDNPKIVYPEYKLIE